MMTDDEIIAKANVSIKDLNLLDRGEFFEVPVWDNNNAHIHVVTFKETWVTEDDREGWEWKFHNLQRWD